MKLLIVLALSLASNAFAFPYDVECTGKLDGKKLKITVEPNFGSRFDPVDAQVTLNGTRSDYRVRGDRFGSYEYSFNGSGFDLRVSFWPDNAPQWGSFYDGTFIGSVSDGRRLRNLRCRFPNL